MSDELFSMSLSLFEFIMPCFEGWSCALYVPVIRFDAGCCLAMAYGSIPTIETFDVLDVTGFMLPIEPSGCIMLLVPDLTSGSAYVVSSAPA